MKNPLVYRPEIDGLRTVAIVPVVLFHAGLTTWSGGFVGVDVFFVISGFLITSIIMEEIGTGTFSYLQFYERRIRRLVPPLIAMLLGTWIAATLLLDPNNYEEFAQSMTTVLTASSNWFFYSRIDYFDGEALSKPLLHMWSLAIEEQFYIVFPTMIILIRHWLPSSLKPFLVLMAVVSFAYATSLVLNDDANNAFYNSLARFWELLAGCALAVGLVGQPSERLAIWCRYAGATLICIAVFGFTEAIPFPGPAALLPTLGAVLIIWAGPGGSDLISGILKSKPFVQVGKVSYSWYLFHWPIAVFLSLTLAPKWLEYGKYLHVAGAAAGLGLAFLSLRYLENPIRRKTAFGSPAAAFGLFAATLAACIILALPGFVPAVADYRLRAVYGPQGAALAVLHAEAAYYKQYLNRNYSGISLPIEGQGNEELTCSFDGKNTQERLIGCLKSQATNHNILVIGDSVGRDIYHSLLRAYPNANFLMLHQSSCVPSDVMIKTLHCFPNLLQILDTARSAIEIDAVVLAFRYRANEWAAVEDNLDSIRERFKKTYMIGVTPGWRATPAAFVQRMDYDNPRPVEIAYSDRSMVPWSYKALSKAAKEMATRHGIEYIDIEPAFCSKNSCRLWLDNDFNKPIFWDQFHLTRYGIETLGAVLRLPNLGLN